MTTQASTQASNPSMNQADTAVDLSALCQKIEGSQDVEHILLVLTEQICDIFACDRLTMYALADDGAHLVPKVAKGMQSLNDLRLPISFRSIAGYVALHREILNLHDVYDELELQRHDAQLHFNNAIDLESGYRSKQMLVAPILDPKTRHLLGVVQLINRRDGTNFSASDTDGISTLCLSLAGVLKAA